jgi:hypothetical protein
MISAVALRLSEEAFGLGAGRYYANNQEAGVLSVDYH